MDNANVSFGFRGEALASISDVSLLEIITKARGSPNGYREVLKGSKCLYLGVNDDRKDVGTTVIVRDLFYNQPVRRKCMQSSLKKVLDSVKKCVLRIAFVNSKVSFKVSDIESDEELLYTRPSSTLSLLMSGFGIEDSSLLHKLDIRSGSLKLSGHISGPCDSSTVKAFQYVYINSRFVCKGQIHKLLNHLATKFEHLDPLKDNSMPQRGKKWRTQACPAYILNLSCPLALYDLAFEPSKTHVEFKDWIPILDFIENSIQQLWTGNMTYGKLLGDETSLCRPDEIWEEDMIHNHEFKIKRHETERNKSSHHLSSPQFKMLTEKVDHSYYEKSDIIPFQEFSTKTLEFKEPELDTEFSHHKLYSMQSLDCAISKNLFTSYDNYFSEDKATGIQRSSNHVDGHILGLEWKNDSTKLRSLEIDDSLESAFPKFHPSFGNELEVNKNNEKPFLQSCSSRKNLPLDGFLFSKEEDPESIVDGFKTKRRRICRDESVDILKVDAKNYRLNMLPILKQQEESHLQKFSACSIGIDLPSDFYNLSEASEKSSSPPGKLCAAEKGLGSDFLVHINNSCSGCKSLNSEWRLPSSDTFFPALSWDDYFPDDDTHEGSGNLGKNTNYRHFADNQGSNCGFSYNLRSKCSGQDNFCSRHTSTSFDFKEYAGTSTAMDLSDCPVIGRDICKFLQEPNVHDELSLKHSNISLPKTEWLYPNFHSRGHESDDKYESKENHSKFQAREHSSFPKKPSGRSQSAPPFYRHKRRFVSLSHHSMWKEGNAHEDLISPETNDVKHLNSQPNFKEDLMLTTRKGTEMDTKEITEGEILKHSQIPGFDTAEGLNSKEIHGSADYGSKWREGCQQITNNDASNTIDNQHNILDIYSGFLYLAGNSLVPESLHKNCLEDAKVLQQVDKKFIPIVASRTLAIIDQHAADERIRLEELRDKVLSGEARTVSYLDDEKELVLPEIGHQLLQNYGAQIRDWGWICNIQARSGSFKKNLNILHQQPTVVTLLAVPCILGVNLSEEDLLEFLQQLADTDGSSAMPQSVLRVLNFKACRGAIMFGDSLLPSECALIVEELKQTSLCFQCAHGRPTIVPLVNLEELHKQIAKLAVINRSSEVWRGLRRHELSFERAAQRLSSARS
ncbi:DNA mismatch repair protein MLH3 isoform X2 [Mercurialis annua]|nr:DNA mismatch repair protein MLH3 isoform X2 [Mercurialis annua]